MYTFSTGKWELVKQQPLNEYVAFLAMGSDLGRTSKSRRHISEKAKCAWNIQLLMGWTRLWPCSNIGNPSFFMPPKYDLTSDSFGHCFNGNPDMINTTNDPDHPNKNAQWLLLHLVDMLIFSSPDVLLSLCQSICCSGFRVILCLSPYRYVTFSREEEAVLCIESVNGYILDGRPLK
jgi:hypothetical protein